MGTHIWALIYEYSYMSTHTWDHMHVISSPGWCMLQYLTVNAWAKTIEPSYFLPVTGSCHLTAYSPLDRNHFKISSTYMRHKAGHLK